MLRDQLVISSEALSGTVTFTMIWLAQLMTTERETQECSDHMFKDLSNPGTGWEARGNVTLKVEMPLKVLELRSESQKLCAQKSLEVASDKWPLCLSFHIYHIKSYFLCPPD